MIHRFSHAGKWRFISDEQLGVLRAANEHEAVEQFESMMLANVMNPLAYFVPHGRKWSGEEEVIGDGLFTIPPSRYNKEWRNDGVAMLNDRSADVVLLMGPNHMGKSVLGAVWSALRLVPTEPEWAIFKYCGVEWREWDGPKIWVVASYSWDNVETVWDRYRRFLPRSELMEYAPNWGKYGGEDGKARPELTFKDCKTKKVKLACGSQLIFRSYTQQQIHWEGFDTDGLHADEQIEREKFVGWQRGTTTRGGYTPCVMTLTGHQVEGRPDTGAGGWIKSLHDEVVGGSDETRVGRVNIYRLNVRDTDDSVVSREEKKKLWRRWVDPNIPRSEKDQRAAVARYWAGWEEGSGLVFDSDVWERAVHIVAPLWADNETPPMEKATLWRVIDYGDTGITAVAWLACLKDFAVLYRLYYERNAKIWDVCKAIIELSGNGREEVGTEYDDETGLPYKLYTERQDKEVFFGTVLDSRSAPRRSIQGPSLQEIFGRFGIDVTTSCGQKNEVQIPRLKDWLRIDWDRDHPFRRNREGGRVKGAAKLYFFEGQCQPLVAEIEALTDKWNTDHHAIDCIKYWASEIPAYMGNFDEGNGEHEDEEDGRKVTPYTGY